MISWMLAKPRLISLGSLEKLLDSINGIEWQWTCEADDDYCTISFNNPDEYGKERPCAFKFPIVGTLGEKHFEKLVLIDGVVEEQVEFSEYEYVNDETGEPYVDTDFDYDWSAAIEPILAAFDKAFNYKMSMNPNL